MTASRIRQTRKVPAVRAIQPPARPWQARHMAGVTLVELVVTLAIAAILMAIAVPSFNGLILNNKLSSASNDLITAINTSRMEAIKRNTSIAVCSDSTCAVTTMAPATIRAGISGIIAPIQIQTVQSLIFSGQGLARAATATAPYSGLVADIYTTQISSNNHRCIYMATGSITRTCTVTGTCPNAQPTDCQQ